MWSLLVEEISQTYSAGICDQESFKVWVEELENQVVVQRVFDVLESPLLFFLPRERCVNFRECSEGFRDLCPIRDKVG